MKLGHMLLVAGALLGVAAVSGFTAPGRRSDQQATLQVDGRIRTYTSHVPSGYDGTHRVPLVLGCRGSPNKDFEESRRK